HQVELVAALNELRDARKVERVEPFELDLHAQRREIVVHVGELGLDDLPLGLLAILRGPLQVRFGERSGLKQVQVGQGLDIGGRVLGKLRNDDVRDVLANDVPLERIVVEEHEGVEPDVQSLLN